MKHHLFDTNYRLKQMSTLTEETYVEFRCQKCWQSNCAPVSCCGQPIACATCDAEMVVPEATPERIARAEQLLAKSPAQSPSVASTVSASVQRGAASDPYAVPSAKALESMLQDELKFEGYDFSNAPLASLVSRLLAVIADGIIDFVALVAGFLLLFGADHLGLFSLESLQNQESLGLELYAIMGFPYLVVKIIQWNLIATRGQTLGKMLFFVRIVCMDGSAPGFVCGVVLRNWIRTALGMIPFFSLIDIAFIFTDSKRCIHDYLAGTRVVQA